MSRVLIYLSDYAIPIVIFYVVISGLFSRSEIFEEFCIGAREGLRTVVQLVPTLIGLMVAIGIMRSSGVFELMVGLIKPLMENCGFPSELAPLVIVKMFSSSAATSILIDLYKEYGADSYLGKVASVMMSASETVFYTLAVYTAAGGIKKTRYIVCGGLLATFVGIILSIILVKL